MKHRAPPALGHLLVVDDNEMNRDMLSRRLARKGFDVTVAEDGAEALQAITECDFDLVLLDIMMPGMDGLQVLESLRRDRTPLDLPVIMATAKVTSDDVVHALKLGANDYVTKPLDFPVVLARVNTQLALRQATRQLEAAHARMKNDLQAAARIQQSLLPSGTPDTAQAAFAWKYLPCDELAGDFLNFFKLDERHVAVFVVDVCGHGVAASLLAVTIGHMLTLHVGSSLLVVQGQDGASHIVPPLEVARELNRRLPMEEQDGLWFTMVYGVLDLETLEFRHVRAGHPEVVHLPRSGAPQLLPCKGMAIGCVEEIVLEEHVIQLSRGDRLFLYSDGVPEAMDPEGKLFGSEQMLEVLERAKQESIESSVELLMNVVDRWGAGRSLDDDLSIVGLEIEP